MLFQTVERQHAQLACKMVVAHTSLSQRGFARTRSNSHGTGSVRDAHQALEEMRDVAVSEPKVAMAALAFNRDQARVEQLRQM